MSRAAVVRLRAAAGALLLAVGALSACSNTQSPIARQPLTGTSAASMVNGVQTVRIRVDQTYRFYPSTIIVHPGEVRIVLHHTGSGAPHDWSLNGFPGDYVALTQAGQTKETTFIAPRPGRYRFVCTIHTEQGQVGTMIVLRH